METTELQAKLASFDHLLPSQREWTERLLFQLAFNDVDHIEAVGAVGSGKSTLALTLAELFSEQYNVALLNTAAGDDQVAGQLMQQWFGLPAQAGVALSEQIAAQAGTMPLLLIIDNTEQFSTILPQLQNLSCLLFSFSGKPLLDDGLTLTINRPTSADAESLLLAEQLNPLEITTRLADADGNLHLLLRPAAQARSAAIIPEYTKPAMPPFKAVYIVIAVVLVAMLLYFFWPESETPDTPVRIPVPIPAVTPEPEDVIAEQDTAFVEPVPEPELIPTIPPAAPEQIVTDDSAIEAENATVPAEQAVSEPDAPEVEEPLVVESFKYDETELLGMDKQQVALQLAVLSSDASLQRFNKAYPQLGSLVYQRNWQGKTQRVILLAPFSNAAAANQQLAQLPEALRTGGPFVKRLQAVQTEINALRRNQQSVPE
ncbi:SPOR domain-containing protein [Rheinheimera sp. EpRS3]|uniref:SPOR domain-containing protein n=1 Tax=Rheinheimera sp. EpRS3 TaxID=1712383 RepID=UPI00074AB744|nr:hypothetical protein [Rheinheimera sp. EpRS3]KUM53158.1 hypothetical protein AR688_04345 [Rheinheimera sp. EpRS3]